MDKKLVKEIQTKHCTLIESVDGTARFWVSLDGIDSYKRVDSDIKYTRQLVQVAGCDLKKIKSSLEVRDVPEIKLENTFKPKRIIGFGEVLTDCIVYNNTPLPWDGMEFIPRVYSKKILERILDLSKCAGTSEGKTFSSVVHFAENGDIVTTDGRQLAVQRTSMRRDSPLSIPTVVFDQFKKPKGDLYISQCGDWLTVSDGETHVVTRNVIPRVGDFPKYERVIPDVVPSQFKPFDIDLKGCKEHKNFLKEHSDKILLSGGKVFCDAAELGTCTTIEGDVMFNWAFLDNCKNVAKVACFLPPEETQWKKIYKPSIFGDMTDYFHVVMPMNF